jgi:hypothetical protein
MNLTDRVLPVIAYFNRDLVDLLAAPVAKPDELIAFSGFTLALEDDEPGVLFEPRRVRYSGRTKKHLSGLYDGGFLLAIFSLIYQILDAGQLQGDFITRINVKISPLFPTAA